ncbi:YhcN/YlaJ family sporulation lipoprotein [Paenibacillus gallinarum]|uniref:YhcN/YlaJ family sporulation lipoprotein n=1 Tax=Paenibacillus gallinarum TaxID=2762232 RepID=A0ABR8T1V8_9BACL|nr:YhcN/YlaJ family sporulation lipoprotein [Paenibacillus gallinarum]MBD7969753.1 YhcN/YlaJ family sporulation lipoprotein [Paenibacillus gallinarum]
MPGMKKTKAVTLSLSAAILMMSALTGCGTSTDDQGVKTNSVRNYASDVNRNVRNGINYGINGINPDRASVHRTTNLSAHNQMSKAISEMNGVGEAYVLRTDHNAYVAVSLKEGVRPQSTRHHNNRNQMNQDLGGVGVNDMGTRAPYTTSGIAPGLRSNDYSQSNMLGDNANGPRGAGGIFNPNSVSMKSQKGPGTYTNKNNTQAEEQVTDEMKQKITKKIKQMDPKVKNVYISANPDFLERAQGYASDLANGHPISGIVSEFQVMMDRIFPAKTTSNQE